MSLSSPSDDLPPIPETSTSGRPARTRRLPKALKDFTPSSVSALRRLTRQRCADVSLQVATNVLPQEPSAGISAQADLTAPSQIPDEPEAGPMYEDREVDGFGLYRSYLVPPVLDPDVVLDPELQGVHDAMLPTRKHWWVGFGRGALHAAADSVFYPFLNATTFRLMNWFYSGSSMKSLTELDRLVSDVILAEDFNPDHLRHFNAAREAKRLDDVGSEPSIGDSLPTSDGWHHTDITIHLPAEGVQHASEEAAPAFNVPGLYYRKLMAVITAALEDAASASWSMVPHRLWWKSPTASPDDPPERVQTEMYNSEAMVLEYEKLTARPRAPGDNLEIAIVGIMLWSDSTHLAQFGNASLWPIYLFFANQSKYVRARPTSFAAHHLAYIPSVSHLFT